MNSLCIKTNDSNSIKYLLNELKNFEIKEIYFSKKEFKKYKNIIIHYKGKDSNKFYSKISTMLSFLVIDELEEEYIRKYLSCNYFYFNNNEIDNITSICFELFTDEFTDLFEEKMDTLKNNFYKYTATNKSLVLNGFLNFRVPKYFEILKKIIDEAISRHLIEKEYYEFISLLRVYINSQIPLANSVHLIYSPTQSILLDENNEVILTNDDIFKAKYLSDISFSANDYTLNSLLNLLPKKIIVHLIEGKMDEFINTIQLIFENRVCICFD